MICDSYFSMLHCALAVESNYLWNLWEDKINKMLLEEDQALEVRRSLAHWHFWPKFFSFHYSSSPGVAGVWEIWIWLIDIKKTWKTVWFFKFFQLCSNLVEHQGLNDTDSNFLCIFLSPLQFLELNHPVNLHPLFFF